MKKILLITLLFPIACFAQKNKSNCYTTDQSGTYHYIPTIAFSYIDDKGDLKWQYCDSLVRKAIATQLWPIDCKTEKKKPLKLTEYNPSYSDLDEYYLHGKIVKPIEIKLRPDYADYYTGTWKYDATIDIDLTEPQKITE